MYKLKYLPLALRDLESIVNYIADSLNNSKAAMDLVNSFDDSISHLQEFPYMSKVYKTTRPLDLEYRILPVRNYLVFYVVTEKEIEIHRIIYARMNLEDLIK